MHIVLVCPAVHRLYYLRPQIWPLPARQTHLIWPFSPQYLAVHGSSELSQLTGALNYGAQLTERALPPLIKGLQSVFGACRLDEGSYIFSSAFRARRLALDSPRCCLKAPPRQKVSKVGCEPGI